MAINLSSFFGSFHDYELDIDYYHGKDIVHQGCLLRLDPDYSSERINPKIRNRIRKAQQLGVKIKHVAGTKQDIIDFRTIWFDPEDVTIPEELESNEIMYLAYLENELVGGMILTPSTSKVLYLHNLGSNATGKKHNIPALLLWHGVEELKDSQYEYIDVGVSFRPTLYRFFKHWQTDSYPIIFTTPFIKPDIRLTPFASDVPSFVQESNERSKEVMRDYFGEKHTVLPRGIYAIKAVLQHIGITEDDSVAVYKTFDNDYISRCVTEPITKLGKLSREINDDTKAVLVIHEFGFPYKDIKNLKKECERRKIPLIEDCAWTYDSAIDAKTKVGQVGDYAIYSLPKILPVQYGAVLKGVELSDDDVWNKYQMLDFFKREVLYAELEDMLPTLEAAADQRRENWKYLASLFEKDGIDTFIDLEEGVTPAVFFIKTDDYQRLFERYGEFGVESGRYYQGDAFFLPVHQALGKRQLDYIYAVYRGMLNLSSNYKRSSKRG